MMEPEHARTLTEEELREPVASAEAQMPTGHVARVLRTTMMRNLLLPYSGGAPYADPTRAASLNNLFADIGA
jgi:hypothetical protein